MTYFTENPWPLTIMFLIVAVFLAWNAMRSRAKRVWQAAGLMAVLAVIPQITHRMIETDKEQVTASIHALADAFVDGDATRALSFLEAGGGVSPELVQQALDRFDIQDGLRIKSIRIEVTGNKATSKFRANGTVSIKNGGSRTGPTSWSVTWKKTGSRWKVIGGDQLNPVNGDVIQSFNAQR